MIKVAYTNHIGHGEHDNRAKSTDISSAADLATAEKHNNHEYTQEDVDRMQSAINLELKPYNKQFDQDLQEVDRLNLIENVKKIYHEQFDEVVEEYNKKQKRKDRKIDDYYEKISADGKSDLAVEGIIQIGSLEDWKDKTLEEKQKTLPIYLDILKEMLREIPGLELAGASFHINESSPHLHWIGVCVDQTEHKKGLSKRVGKSAVLTQDVLGDLLQTKLRERMEAQVKDVFGWEFEDKKSGRNEDLSKNEYKNKQLQDENRKLREENERLTRKASKLENAQSYWKTAARNEKEQTRLIWKANEKQLTEFGYTEKQLKKAKIELASTQNLQRVVETEIAGKVEDLERAAAAAVDPLKEIEKDIIPDQNKVDFIIQCLNQFKGAVEPIYNYCSKLYRKWTESRQKAAEEVLEAKTALDAQITDVKRQMKEKNPDQDHRRAPDREGR